MPGPALIDLSKAAAATVAELPQDVAGLSDTDLLDLARAAAVLLRHAQKHSTVIAGEIARRSVPEFGQAGLAQRTGHRTPEELIRVTTGSTARDASLAVRVGSDESPWLTTIRSALRDGDVSVQAVDAIRAGLGQPSPSVPIDVLGAAAETLLEESHILDADRLQRRARELRDEIDTAGIAEREEERRARRSLRFFRLPDGMSRLVWTLDPESAAVVGSLFDRATSPRRGGPRFVAPDEKLQRILDDTRTVDQLASDVFLELLRQGADADSSQLLGSGAPVVNVLVAKRRPSAQPAHGSIEGETDPVSIETIEWQRCSGATVSIGVDSDGQPVDVGREQRLFTRQQRRALAARDGGCRWPGCSRPPSWTEAHHLAYWARDGGPTDIENGMLLCKHHHLLLHNFHWDIERVSPDYWLIPPASIDNARTPILMPSKSRTLAEVLG